MSNEGKLKEYLNYNLMRSNRKTIAIKITVQGEIKVLCPQGCSKNYIDNIMEQKSKWILKKLEEIRKRAEGSNMRGIKNGDFIDVNGIKYELKINEGASQNKSWIEEETKKVIIEIEKKASQENSENIIRELVKQCLALKTRKVFIERTEHYCNKLSLRVGKITVKDQKSLWGSCSAKNNLNYNWKLILAPKEVLDYVVVHEVCHIKHKNHSKDFWGFVEEAMPEYKKFRKWLKVNGGQLMNYP